MGGVKPNLLMREGEEKREGGGWDEGERGGEERGLGRIRMEGGVEERGGEVSSSGGGV